MSRGHNLSRDFKARQPYFGSLLGTRLACTDHDAFFLLAVFPSVCSSALTLCHTAGNDLNEEITPVEAGLTWTIAKSRREACDFLGGEVCPTALSLWP